MQAQPGDFGVTPTDSWVGKAIQRVTRSPVNHAFIYVGNDTVIEARPFRAGYMKFAQYPHAVMSSGLIDLTPEQRQGIVTFAVAHIGTKYNFLDDAALAIAKVFGVHSPEFVRKRLSRGDRLQCSQFVDYDYANNNKHLFNDGRLFGDVTPGDLYDLLVSLGASPIL